MYTYQEVLSKRTSDYIYVNWSRDGVYKFQKRYAITTIPGGLNGITDFLDQKKANLEVQVVTLEELQPYKNVETPIHEDWNYEIVNLSNGYDFIEIIVDLVSPEELVTSYMFNIIAGKTTSEAISIIENYLNNTIETIINGEG